MAYFRIQQRLVGWIAILAVLLALFSPLLASAQAAGRDVSWVQLCSAHGSKWIAVDVDQSDGAPAALYLSGHCPWCAGHAPLMGPPPAPLAVMVVLDLKRAYPPAFLAAPRTLHAWTRAHARAPPIFS